jgi:DNA-binding protein YbaB
VTTNAPEPHGDETTTPHGEETTGGPDIPIGQDPLLGDAGKSDAGRDAAAGPASVPREAGIQQSGLNQEDVEEGNLEEGDLEEDEYEDDEEYEDEEDEGFAPAPFDLFGAGAGGMGGLGGLFSQLGKVRDTVANAQQAADTEIEGTAGGGAVRIVGTAGLDFRAVIVDPSMVQGDDVELLQDLLLAAMRDFAERAREVQQQAMGDFGGMDFGSLFGG